jgi:rhodanese-related sulfurtransferase
LRIPSRKGTDTDGETEKPLIGEAIMNLPSYAGDVDPAAAWRALSEDPSACLVDVRTNAEWSFVGVPDLGALGKRIVCVSWKLFPDNADNPEFVEQVRAMGVAPEQPVYLICRSGQRSMYAAIALTAAGFATCYNVAQGFEGDKDGAGHRGTVGGWKIAGLPWQQG